MVPFTQETDDLLGSLRHGFSGDSRTEDVVQPECSGNPFLRCREGHHDEVVLILPGSRKALGLQNANHLTWHTLGTDCLANRILVAKEIVHHRLTEDAHWRGCIHVSLSKESPQPHLPPSNQQKLGRDSSKMCRPILSLINDLNGSIRIGRHRLD